MASASVRTSVATQTMSLGDQRRLRLVTAGTTLRILLAPVVMGLIVLGNEAELVAAAVFVFAATTDVADGYLARRWSVTTALGSFLDTTADKLLVSCALIALLGVERASPWIVAIIISREILILGLRSAAAIEGTVIEASGFGKRKAALQFIAITLAVLRPGGEIGGFYLDEYVLLVAAVVTVASAADYVWRFSSTITAR